MAKYTLYLPRIRDTLEETITFPTGRRTRWTATLHLSAVGSGTVEVAIEASPTVDEDLFTQVLTFTALSTVQTVTKRSFITTPDFTITERDLYLRGVVVAITGGIDWVWELEMEAPFLTMADDADKNLLAKEFRGHDSIEVERIVKQAERDVVDFILDDPNRGRFGSWINAPNASDAIKWEISQQASHIFRREQLTRKKDAAAQKTLREMPEMYVGIGKRLKDFLPAEAIDLYLGRG